MDIKKMRRLLHSAKLMAIVAAAVYTIFGVEPLMAGTKDAELPEHIPNTVRMVSAATPDTVEAHKENEDLVVEILVHDVLEKNCFIDWSADESYLLAKLAMAEAEGEDIEGKALVMLVVMNRVRSDSFPDTVEDVILEEHNGVHQFSVAGTGGRWYTVEPDEDCYKALELIMVEGWDESEGALYFESRGDSSWHQNNLRYLFKHGRHYFYTNEGD